MCGRSVEVLQGGLVCQVKHEWEKWAKLSLPLLVLEPKGQRCLTCSLILPLGGSVFLVPCVHLSLIVKAFRDEE